MGNLFSSDANKKSKGQSSAGKSGSGSSSSALAQSPRSYYGNLSSSSTPREPSYPYNPYYSSPASTTSSRASAAPSTSLSSSSSFNRPALPASRGSAYPSYSGGSGSLWSSTQSQSSAGRSGSSSGSSALAPTPQSYYSRNLANAKSSSNGLPSNPPFPGFTTSSSARATPTSGLSSASSASVAGQRGNPSMTSTLTPSRTGSRTNSTLSKTTTKKATSADDTQVLLFLSSISSIPAFALSSSLHRTFFLPEHGFEFRTIQSYLTSGQEHGYGMELLRVARFIRENDYEFHTDQPNAPTKFESNATTPFPPDKRFRMILWHGTKKDAIAPIIRTGFILPQNRGQMFGNGIYFADRASKSANYCGDGKAPGSTGYLFLCDVMLGKHYKARSAQSSFTKPPPGHDSVKGMGKRVPDWTENKLIKGSIVPVGKTLDDPRASELALMYNEYIVYDTSKVKIKYLVEFKYHAQPVTIPVKVKYPNRSRIPRKAAAAEKNTAFTFDAYSLLG